MLQAFILCATTTYSQKDKGFNFPPDFGKTPTLVIVGPALTDKVQEGILEAFEKEYEGKYESFYSRIGKNNMDTSVHMYRLHVKERPSEFEGSDDYKFGLTDLRTGKFYEAEFWSGSYKKGARYYVKHLEEFRKANGGK